MPMKLVPLCIWTEVSSASPAISVYHIHRPVILTIPVMPNPNLLSVRWLSDPAITCLLHWASAVFGCFRPNPSSRLRYCHAA
jgi:hypothetical protein